MGQSANQFDVYLYNIVLEFEQGFAQASITTLFNYLELIYKKGLFSSGQVSLAFHNIGSGHLKIKDYFNALKYYQKGLTGLNSLRNKANYEILTGRISLAVIHRHMGFNN